MNGLRALVLCLVIACAAVVAPAAAVPPGWSALPVPAATPPVTVFDLAARGPGEAWATGYEQAADGPRPMLYRWDGTAWARDTGFPGAGEPGLLGKVQFVGEEVWIFHDRRGTGEPLRRSAAGWSSGSRDGAQVLLRRDGNDWRDVPVPPGAVYGLHILAADDVWAAGATDSGAAVAHWDGQAWQQTVVDGFPRSAVGSVLAVSPTEVWAGGTAGFVGGPVGRPIPPLLVRWNGQAWNRVSVPADFGSVTSLTPTASGSLAWVSVVRSQRWGPPGSTPPLVPGPDFLAWNEGSFTEYGEPAVAGEGDSSMLRLTPVPGTATVWSTGRADGPEGTFAPRILRFG
ncbi:hypothetical protein ACFZC7_20570 [Streptomyces massasporeus]|uniref:hypothetical protein n=1 Tax=Streptomyces massasporeus TaxID=67324 RepID=UPI0036EC6209